MPYTSLMPQVSIVFPAYNEETRLPTTLASVHAFCSEEGLDFEIVVVNDGSKDGTIAAVENFAKHHDGVRLISYQVNMGKGHAVRKGALAAEGDLILINDSDGSSPICELLRLRDAIGSGADLAIGSRAKHSAETKVQALAYRTYVGNTFNRLVQSLLLPGIYDTQCGFKLFKRSVAHDIFKVARVDGYAFDVEVLYLAKLSNYTIEEVPINWNNVEGSKVNVFVDSVKMFFEVLHIWINALLGRYRRDEHQV